MNVFRLLDVCSLIMFIQGLAGEICKNCTRDYCQSHQTAQAQEKKMKKMHQTAQAQEKKMKKMIILYMFIVIVLFLSL